MIFNLRSQAPNCVKGRLIRIVGGLVMNEIRLCPNQG